MRHFLPPQIVAEIACNHQGDFETACRMVRVAADFCGVHVVKFQKRDPATFTDEKPHPNPAHAFGRTYAEHRRALEFTVDQHAEFKAVCQHHGVKYACSVFDQKSLEEVASLKPLYIKFGSAVNDRFDLFEKALHLWTGPIHVSLGMTTREDVVKVFRFFKDAGAAKRLTLYHCVTGYPVRAEHAYVGEIDWLVGAFGDQCAGIGYSGHHQGVAIDLVAYNLGASWIERHLTLDRTAKGTDHAASLEPDGLRKVRKYLWDAFLASPEKGGKMPPCELAAFEKFKNRGCL